MKIIFIMFLLPLQLFAQDITGVWTGTMYNDTTKQLLNYELAISENNGKLDGYSHTIFIIDGKKNIGVKSVKIKNAANKYLLEDDKLLYNNYSEPPAKGVRMYSELFLTENDTAMMLTGAWKTNRTKNYSIVSGTLSLKKKKDFQKTLIIPKLEDLGLTNSLSFFNARASANGIAQTKKNSQINAATGLRAQPNLPLITIKTEPVKIIPEQKAAAEITTRKIETIRSVDVKSDSLMLTLYDNGEVDGDTVSVLLNGKVIMPMQGLSTKAINKTIYFTPDMGDSIKLIMYAENLGSIPPNTGLLVVHDGEDVYEIRFSGDLQKNSAIILRRKKKN